MNKIPSDIEIAKKAKMRPIMDLAKDLGFTDDEIIPYGKYKAKIKTSRKKDKSGKLILVTAINPTPAGEGKTTTTVGLGQAFYRLGYNSAIALREPSLGPVFGLKGGAAGGGYSQVVPMEDINLHFTGDLHAITAANNLLCAMIDNHLFQGNELNINPEKIIFKRVLDMNDRALRKIVIGINDTKPETEHSDGFMITVASEIMAILCLAESLKDLKKRLGNILVAYRYDDTPVYARDLKAEGAMTALLKDALLPNLVQTIENSPAFIHGGPFANIAHGCNSVAATRLVMSNFDYCITEAGFGSDLGGEKFLDIKCRKMGVTPSCIVLVATVRALKYNGGIPLAELSKENVDALKIGVANLEKHIENLKGFGIPVVVALNVFANDTEKEIAYVKKVCEDLGCDFELSYAHAKGGQGTEALAKKVVKACEKPAELKFTYELNESLYDKMNAIATKIYGADGIKLTEQAQNSLKLIEKLGYSDLPVCMAKTQYSLSDNPTLLCRPKDYTITISDMKVCSGAGFVVAYLGNIMTMPGLPKRPAAEGIDVDENEEIVGLF